MTSPDPSKLPSLGNACKPHFCVPALPHSWLSRGMQCHWFMHGTQAADAGTLQRIQCTAHAAPDVRGTKAGLNLEHSLRRHRRIQIRNQEPVTDWLGTDAESWHSFVGPGETSWSTVFSRLCLLCNSNMHASQPLLHSMARNFYRGNSVPEKQNWRGRRPGNP